MTRPLLLDLFAGAGGSAVGYHRAGFDVVGVDLVSQPNYPFKFFMLDALRVVELLPRFIRYNLRGRTVAAIHASPPCQAHTTLAKGNNGNQEKYPDLIDVTRELLISTGLPYVIENVPTAPLHHPITLCGEMFGLGVIRHRAFESNVLLMQPQHVPHRGRVAGWRHGQKYDGPYYAIYGNGGGKWSLADWQRVMEMPWAKTKREIAEAIPPRYSEYVGAQLLSPVVAGVGT